MKHLFLFLVLSLLFFISNAQISGCIASYSFNNGNANDEIGMNDGIVSGATLTTDRFGNPNHAYQFDAANLSKIIIPNHSTNDFVTLDEFSFSFWVKFDSANGASSLISKHSFPAYDAYAVWSNNTIDLAYCNGQGKVSYYTASAPMEDACSNALPALDFNNWQHIVACYGGAVNTTKLYINNVLQTDIGSVSGIIANGTDLIVGAAYDGMSSGYHSFFTGKIDDIGIYHRALNSFEVDSLYHMLNPLWPSVLQESLSMYQDFDIYPNPAHHSVNFSRECDASIIDMVGEIKIQAHHVKTLDISLLKKGIYMVRVANPQNQKVLINKLVID